MNREVLEAFNRFENCELLDGIIPGFHHYLETVRFKHNDVVYVLNRRFDKNSVVRDSVISLVIDDVQ